MDYEARRDLREKCSYRIRQARRKERAGSMGRQRWGELGERRRKKERGQSRKGNFVVNKKGASGP